MELIQKETEPEKMLEIILKQFGKHFGETKPTIEAMSSNKEIRAYFRPYLHYLLLTIQVAEIFGAELSNQEYVEFILSQVKEKQTELDALISETYEGLMGSALPEDDLKDAVSSLKEQAAQILEDLKGKNELAQEK